MAPVVVDAETTSYIQETHRSAEARELNVDLPGFLKCILKHGNVVYLASDMEVEQT